MCVCVCVKCELGDTHTILSGSSCLNGNKTYVVIVRRLCASLRCVVCDKEAQ